MPWFLAGLTKLAEWGITELKQFRVSKICSQKHLDYCIKCFTEEQTNKVSLQCH